MEHLAAEELEGTVDVADRHVEECPYEVVPRLGDEAAMQRVLPVDAITGHDVDALDPWQEALELVEVELVVGVGEEHEVHPRGAEAAVQRLAVAEVARVADETDAGIEQ